MNANAESTMAPPHESTGAAALSALMQDIESFAAAWYLVGERFGEESALKDAQAQKEQLQQKLAAILGDRAALHKMAQDAARYQWLREFLLIEDIGDDQVVYGLRVLSEDMEMAGTVPFMRRTTTVDEAIDAARGVLQLPNPTEF